MADHVSAQIHPYAASVRRVAFPDQRPKYDIADWIKEHDPETVIADFEHMIATAPLWQPPAAQPAAMNDPWASEGMDTFLMDAEEEPTHLVPNVLVPGCITQIFAPRGIGKSVLAAFWAVGLALSGKRVLMLDRDNPRCTVKNRLRHLGADNLGEQKSNLRVIARERCPKLTEYEKWASFPYADFDSVIVDSWAFVLKESANRTHAKPARALAPSVGLCRAETVRRSFYSATTIKSGEHSR